jgi:hypothetical protein
MIKDTKKIIILKKNNHPLLVTPGIKPQKIKIVEDTVIGKLKTNISIFIFL